MLHPVQGFDLFLDPFNLFLITLDLFLNAFEYKLVVIMADDLRLMSHSRKLTAVSIKNCFRVCEQRLEIHERKWISLMGISFSDNVLRFRVGNMAIPMDGEGLYHRIVWRAQPDIFFQNSLVWLPRRL